MLVIFTSKGHGDITMFGNVAEHLIGLMGHSGTIPGAIAARDIPDALERLKNAIALEDTKLDVNTADDNNDETAEPTVSLYNRAFPLMEMLAAAIKEDSSLMWRKM